MPINRIVKRSAHKQLTHDIELNTVSVGTQSARLRLNHISCSFGAGEIIAVIGPNGAGKSSLLSAISHQIPLHKGQINLFGLPHTDWTNQQRAKHLAFLPQKHQLNMPFLVQDVLALARLYQNTSPAQNEEIIQRTLAAFDGSALFNRCYTALSGGEQQRVHLARTFAQLDALGDLPQRPGLLLLDEPTAALDLPHQSHLVQAIRRAANNGLTVMVSLHDLTLAAQIATRVLCLDRGHLKALGRVSDVIEPLLLAEVFRIPIECIHTPKSGAPLLFIDHSTP